MIPITTDVRLKHGIPKTVASIIVGTFLFHVFFQGLIDFKLVGQDFRWKNLAFHFDDPDLWSLLTSIFTHGDYWHWAGNMLYLWIFGSILEDRLGAGRFFGLFLFCGFAATGLHWSLLDIAQHYLHLPQTVKELDSLGASGAISGLMGMAMARFYQARVLLLMKVSPTLWVRRYIPIWTFCLFTLGLDLWGLFSGDHVAHLTHLGGFIGGLAVGPFLGLRKQSEEEIHLDLGLQFRQARAFKPALDEFREALKINPENAFTYECIGYCYLGLHRPDKTADTHREDARRKFEEALEIYLKQEKFQEATVLFERLMKFFDVKDFPEKIPVLLRAQQPQDGLAQAVLTSDPGERRRVLLENFTGQAHRGSYQGAYQALQELKGLLEPEEMAPGTLEQAGEVCLRVKDQKGAEVFFERLSKKGDDRQTVRALSVLSRRWLRTPKQRQLAVLYKNAEERLLNLKLFDEWLQLGEKLAK
jgi:membrane associated rhomboid family serine protease/tetratricopeptide (TPR) repeat protein